MDVDAEFICPRPRNPRACNNCRSRKIRCLPAGKDSSRGTCRRCAKFGYTCSYTADSKCCAQPGQSLDHGSPQNDDDIISGLFRNRPPPTGGVDQLMDLHRRVFQKQSHQDSPPDPSSIPTPESLGHPSGSECDKNISMREADKLLSLFRKSIAYFPFVNIPESTSAASMAIHQPFLLLAILTVSSSRMPRLQQQTDERFRRVLSERIVLHGEKSLDYVQGLLVYIAWYPLYLRPLRNQIPQYLQIVSTMISDLDRDSNLEEKSERRNASLGCHALSCISSIGRRFNDRRTRIDTYLQASSNLDSDDLALQYLRIQDLAERVSRCRADVRDMAKTASNDSRDGEISIPSGLEEVREKMAFLTHELEDLYWSFPAESHSKIPIRLTRQFFKVNITSIPLILTNTNPYQVASPTLPKITVDLNHAASHFSEIQSFLELFLSIPPDEYIHFSIREWSQLVVTISFTSELCFSQNPLPCIPDVIQRTTWIEFQAQTRAKMLIYLESLTHRMGTLSVLSASASTYPDSFYMFKSVLGILVHTYAPAVNHSSIGISTGTSEIQKEEAGMSSSRCPILNRSIKETDFWRALERNTHTGASHMRMSSGGDFEDQPGNGSGNGDGFQSLDVDDLVNHPQDWPSVFEEWVVDLNNLPE